MGKEDEGWAKKLKASATKGSGWVVVSPVATLADAEKLAISVCRAGSDGSAAPSRDTVLLAWSSETGGAGQERLLQQLGQAGTGSVLVDPIHGISRNELTSIVARRAQEISPRPVDASLLRPLVDRALQATLRLLAFSIPMRLGFNTAVVDPLVTFKRKASDFLEKETWARPNEPGQVPSAEMAIRSFDLNGQEQVVVIAKNTGTTRMAAKEILHAIELFLRWGAPDQGFYFTLAQLLQDLGQRTDTRIRVLEESDAFRTPESERHEEEGEEDEEEEEDTTKRSIPDGVYFLRGIHSELDAIPSRAITTPHDLGRKLHSSSLGPRHRYGSGVGIAPGIFTRHGASPPP
eukprot:scaffold301_cov243-Pinguiococcus_pyrenoidosus.AAC.105